ncbi:hypothetical protein TSAR_015099 [Trichomalopsis sarcophagae]|uniref:Uncharacterized protein n=1 Tax=Trichomalopsis sarcophagae TaxID=543379 RepID=A0A232EJ87_9HYME|nr:hypothetical protein TSAR_015099 [Trichomalopsis sarcophagae]
MPFSERMMAIKTNSSTYLSHRVWKACLLSQRSYGNKTALSQTTDETTSSIPNTATDQPINDQGTQASTAPLTLSGLTTFYNQLAMQIFFQFAALQEQQR